MLALEQVTLRQFKQELLQHLGKFAPELYAIRGDDCFRKVIDDGVARAAKYGFTLRGPVRFFLECELSYGCEFDTDIQMSAVAAAFADTDPEDRGGQLERADEIFDVLQQFQDETRGAENEYAVQALQKLGQYMERINEFGHSELEGNILRLMSAVYPEKFYFVGNDMLRVLISQATAEAERLKVATPAGTALLAALMFALGSGITRDPLYPWVSHTLTEPPDQDPEKCVERLRKKAQTYLGATLSTLAA